jgi:aspartyl-tRNA(Asn)/glutamyl-tRNA(Gln) amidotransferase subunit A
MNQEDLGFTPATELARMIRDKEVSPLEVMDAVLARAEALNPTLNAICTWTADAAREQARAAEAAVMRGEKLGPLHGVPTTIKDLAFTKGVRTMAGSWIHAERVPAEDAPFVERLAEAGAISIGKTTVPEFGWKGCGDSPVTGASHNPWKHGTNAGGSSTGAAICAAAGIGPIHQGSDGAGSIRMPAAFCGVFGMKPSYGRVPYYPATNNDHMSHVGPLTRTVADGALMLQVMAGPDDRDMASLPEAPHGWLTRLDAGIVGLRVAYSPDLGHLRIDPEVAGVVRDAVRAFEDLGCAVEEVDPGFGDLTEVEHLLFTANFAGNLGPLLHQWRDRIDPGLVALTEHGLRYSAADYVRARAARMGLYDRVRRFFERFDLLLTPALSVAAFPVNTLMPAHWEQHPWDWLCWAGFSWPFNLTWVPAATCPCGFTKGGLPVGLQIVAGRFQDLRVLQASRAFEQARPWSDRRPPV